mmetsp:Transcript_46264/g.124273  ORF Transcript_46264/g.124273 Transcript_46264/m.124273 type:complete len:448 (+) Transcript_46264:537-1880(+)
MVRETAVPRRSGRALAGRGLGRRGHRRPVAGMALVGGAGAGRELVDAVDALRCRAGAAQGPACLGHRPARPRGVAWLPGAVGRGRPRVLPGDSLRHRRHGPRSGAAGHPAAGIAQPLGLGPLGSETRLCRHHLQRPGLLLHDPLRRPLRRGEECDERLGGPEEAGPPWPGTRNARPRLAGGPCPRGGWLPALRAGRAGGPSSGAPGLWQLRCRARHQSLGVRLGDGGARAPGRSARARRGSHGAHGFDVRAAPLAVPGLLRAHRERGARGLDRRGRPRPRPVRLGRVQPASLLHRVQRRGRLLPPWRPRRARVDAVDGGVRVALHAPARGVQGDLGARGGPPAEGRGRDCQGAPEGAGVQPAVGRAARRPDAGRAQPAGDGGAGSNQERKAGAGGCASLGSEAGGGGRLAGQEAHARRDGLQDAQVAAHGERQEVPAQNGGGEYRMR